jgi:DNA replication protein DnaC
MPRQIVRAVRDYADAIDARLDEGRGLWLMGDVGTGKTTLATLVSKAALDAGRSVAIYSLPDLVRQIRRTYDDGAGLSDVELIDRLAAVDLLQLDDLGAERTSDWVLEQLYSIVNARYEAERSIVLTTNISDIDELRSQVGERTVSRLTEMCELIPVFGSDHRMELHGA